MRSQTQLAMRPEPDEFETVLVRLSVNQHQVGLDVTVAVIGPSAGERVVEIPTRERYVGGQLIDDGHQGVVERPAVPP